jgi:hypothetical protein
MTKKELETRVAELERLLLKQTEKKPSRTQQCWNRVKPYIIPFILGMMLGTALSATAYRLHPTASPTTLEQQAALGGAAIPFPSVSPLPMLSALPQDNSTTESTASKWMSPSEPPLPDNPPADDGLTNSTRLFRRLARPIR